MVLLRSCRPQLLFCDANLWSLNTPVWCLSRPVNFSFCFLIPFLRFLHCFLLLFFLFIFFPFLRLMFIPLLSSFIMFLFLPLWHAHPNFFLVLHCRLSYNFHFLPLQTELPFEVVSEACPTKECPWHARRPGAELIRQLRNSQVKKNWSLFSDLQLSLRVGPNSWEKRSSFRHCVFHFIAGNEAIREGLTSVRAWFVISNGQRRN